MIFPFESLSDERRALGLGVAVVVGVAFGFVQERSGFGRAQKLVGQFYGYDMTVLKVMFTAIVTAMLGTVVLSGLGLLDLHAVEFNYPTYLWPMIVGGLILGVGFILSGYCPGTSFVAATSGKLDGLVTVLGVMLGTLVYAEVEPAMGGFQSSGRLGGFFLYQWLHVPRPLLAVLIAVLAVVAFSAASRIERLVRERASQLRRPDRAGDGEAARGSESQRRGTVLVTEASSGIGADLARAFGRSGRKDMHPNADANTRWLDQSEIRTQQALGPLVLVAAYVVNDWRLVAAHGGFLLLTALHDSLGPYALLYRWVLEPLGVVKPDLRADNPEPHRFAAIFGFSVLSVAAYLLAKGHASAGWMLAWTVAILGGVAFFGWCAGCFMYYVIHRFGAGGFFGRAPVEGTAFLGVRPPKTGER